MLALAVEPLCHPRRSCPLISTDVKTERRRTEVDLTVIVICSIVPLALYMAFNPQITSLMENPEAHILTRLLSVAVFQFGTAGLGITKGVWLNWGAIACGVFCLLIHGLVGVTPDALMEAVTVFAIIYGMLVVKEQTGNAWGTVFVFLFFWNAI